MKKKGPPSRKAAAFELPPMLPFEEAFEEIVGLIQEARERAYQAANTELVGLYWQVGRYIHEKLETAAWGEGVVDQLARHLARTLPGLRGFSRQNLFRMRRFFATYAGDEKVSPLVTQLPWTHFVASEYLVQVGGRNFALDLRENKRNVTAILLFSALARGFS